MPKIQFETVQDTTIHPAYPPISDPYDRIVGINAGGDKLWLPGPVEGPVKVHEFDVDDLLGHRLRTTVTRHFVQGRPWVPIAPGGREYNCFSVSDMVGAGVAKPHDVTDATVRAEGIVRYGEPMAAQRIGGLAIIGVRAEDPVVLHAGVVLGEFVINATAMNGLLGLSVTGETLAYNQKHSRQWANGAEPHEVLSYGE